MNFVTNHNFTVFLFQRKKKLRKSRQLPALVLTCNVKGGEQRYLRISARSALPADKEEKQPADLEHPIPTRPESGSRSFEGGVEEIVVGAEINVS